MPRDIEIGLPPHHAAARPLAAIDDAGDAALLALLGMFTMMDAVLVVLWAVM
ncbi:MAG TPA: hypothetical protein VN681_16035 [Stellaceae bacterium]|nr:hypothetical protein [Stellaceae bacterium]